MSDTSDVNSQIVNALGVVQENTLSGRVSKLSGAGKAYQSVSQSSAIAVQDATDTLRSVSAMATTAMGVAMAQMLSTGDVETYKSVIETANSMVSNSTENFAKVGANASGLLEKFPVGE